METIILPEIKLFKQDPDNRLYSWTDNYGALVIASKYSGLELILDERYKYFCWHHGCHGPWENVHPGLLTYNSPDKNLKYFVGSTDQELFLKSHGYHRVKAIGLPIIYVAKPEVPRLKKSLLIMPSHSLRGQQDVDRSVIRNYVEFVSEYTGYYDRVAVCIHHSCIENGLWVDEFKDSCIEIIEGARTDDENALLRQLYLFQQFEDVTTNNWGSHVAYALYCGCKVSISGPYHEKTYSDALKDGTWARNKEALSLFRSTEVKSRKDAFLSALYRSPVEGSSDIELGNYFVGMANKVTPLEMRIQFSPSTTDKITSKAIDLVRRPIAKVYRKFLK